MSKVTLDTKVMFHPRPVFLVGAHVDGRPNFLVVGGGGVACSEPRMLTLPILHSRYTLKGIRENMTFSVNLPSADMVKETDYCGLVSGAKVDKVAACKFKVFYGRLSNAPLIEQCPINQEFKVVHILNLGSHSLVIGVLEETYFSESCLTAGKLDIRKVNALIFDPQNRQYLTLGPVIGDAYGVGKQLKVKE